MVIYNCSNCRGGRTWTLPRWIGSILQLERQSTCCTLGFRWLGEMVWGALKTATEEAKILFQPGGVPQLGRGGEGLIFCKRNLLSKIPKT